MAVWAPRGQTPIVRAHPGREKINFYGSLNLETGQTHTMRATTMNSATTAEHLQNLLDLYPDDDILLFWDRAPWHRGDAVRELLAGNPRLEVIFFPPASPELNPHEQVWKATRRAISHNHTMTRMPELADKFERHLESTTFPSSFLDKYGYTAICPMLN